MMNVSKVEFIRKVEMVFNLKRTDIDVVEYDLAGTVSSAVALTSEEEACDYMERLNERIKRNGLISKVKPADNTANFVRIYVVEA